MEEFLRFAFFIALLCVALSIPAMFYIYAEPIANFLQKHLKKPQD